jgi:ABC-type uncharacterized transport system auxiliary subunit
MKRIGFLLVLLLFGLACMSSAPKRYHQLFLPENPELASSAIEKSIFIDRVRTTLFYDNFEIVYRRTPYQLNYYTFDFWAEKPALLVRDTIFDYFKKNKVFSEVFKELDVNEADYRLIADIRAIEEEDQENAWFARLSMEIEVFDYSSGERILTHSFDRRKQLAPMDVSQLPVAISQILEEELIKIIQALSDILR